MTNQKMRLNAAGIVVTAGKEKTLCDLGICGGFTFR